MRDALEHVVSLGGGRNAYLDGYRVGGKTGTAQKAVNGVYQSGNYNLSMIAAAPMNDPQVMALFSGPEVMGVTKEEVLNEIGSAGVPEFGTNFVKGLL